MSISSALYTATSGLMAQGKALSSISGNIANSSTVGFKGTGTNFTSYLNKTTSVDTQTGGVLASNYRNIGRQGDIQSSSTTSNLAISGDGFFVVSNSSANGGVMYTRNGSFTPDANGYLTNSDGVYLYGWALDENGKVIAGNKGSVDSLTAVKVTGITGTPKATTEMAIDGNLPSDADAGDSFTYDVEMFDSLGNSHAVTLTWTKTGENSWSLSANDPTKPTDSTVTTGTIGGFPVDITFNADGSLATMDPDPPTITVTGWTTGAGDSTVTLDLGTAGRADGLTQYASGASKPALDLENRQNGYKPGTFSGTRIDENGIVRAVFDNGESRAIYQIPIATFPNPNGLDSETGNLFKATAEAGAYQLRTAGDGKAGSITASALESSTVELTDEFSRMIVAQQAYTAASKVVTTSQEMIDTLLATKR
ncbi:flagellar hook protein FlgE [Azospirillum halopraeferens]|uniref:flagellar hook protein FlgE n=1 Tax=Azospirillum halopraeferens TaxID=34010 RepID=UPI00041E5025|nr:flagellar hook protein FlgE [Azospirillum halopraeferens]